MSAELVVLAVTRTKTNLLLLEVLVRQNQLYIVEVSHNFKQISVVFEGYSCTGSSVYSKS